MNGLLLQTSLVPLYIQLVAKCTNNGTDNTGTLKKKKVKDK